MKKKLFLLLLPLTLSMVSCGKDVEAKMDKVDLARLLNDEEITQVFENVNESLTNRLSSVEVNIAVLSTDLVNQKREQSGSGKYVIKGEEYAEGKVEVETKVTSDFYSYTNKIVQEYKVAAFGEYYLNYSKSYTDGQTQNAEESLSYTTKGKKGIVQAIGSAPTGEGDVSTSTIGVDKSNNVYLVYSSESMTTSEGRDKDGKDATFKEKSTVEILAKYGKLNDAKIESYKVVRKREVNYDKELKIYSDYQIIESYVTSYKFEYKSRGNNEGKDQFINSLPNESVQSGSVELRGYYDYGYGDYYLDYSENLSLSSTKSDFYSGNYTAKATNVRFNPSYYYAFIGRRTALKIDKNAKTIEAIQDVYGEYYLYIGEYFDETYVSVNGTAMYLYKLKDSTNVAYFDFELMFEAQALSIEIIEKVL